MKIFPLLTILCTGVLFRSCGWDFAYLLMDIGFVVVAAAVLLAFWGTVECVLRR